MTSIKNVISIRNFKGVPEIQENFAENQWLILKPEINAILNNENVSKSFEEIYRIVADLHKFNCESLMLNNLRELLESDLTAKLNNLLEVEDGFLPAVRQLWKEFTSQIKTLKNIFINFERSPKNGQYNCVQFISSALFKNIIILNPVIKQRILDTMLARIEEERMDETIDVELLASITGMLTFLQTYTEVFHNEFVRVSTEFYKNKGNALIAQLDVSDYLRYVDDRIQEEIARGKSYVNANTSFEMVSLVEVYMLKNHAKEILDSGFENLINTSNFNDLSLLYELIRRTFGGFNILSDYFIEYVNKEGMKIIDMPDHEMIQKLLDFKEKLNYMLENCFRKNRIMYEDMRKAFTKFINSQQNRPAQLLAKFVDQKLRSKDISMDELEKILSEVMVIFRLIQGKDIFEAFYKKDLAKRLLLGKSTSQDAENSMISKLKYECGSSFTTKIEGMFNDINISREINFAFKQHLNKQPKTDENTPDLSINVLTSSFWPSYPLFNVILPPELGNYQTIFQKFYAANHSGKKLIWQPNLGHCVLKASFDCGKKELQVSLFQTLVLLLFNTGDEFTYNEIKEATNLDATELKRTLISLSCGKSRVLLKKPKGLEIEDTDTFIFNNSFTDKLFRIRINQIQLKETKEDEKATEQSVMIDRQFQIDAAIVRIMKYYKFINHNTLISELYNKLGIPVKPSDLKKRIELLIEREYMERDKDNPANYNYIA